MQLRVLMFWECQKRSNETMWAPDLYCRETAADLQHLGALRGLQVLCLMGKFDVHSGRIGRARLVHLVTTTGSMSVASLQRA